MYNLKIKIAGITFVILHEVLCDIDCRQHADVDIILDLRHRVDGLVNDCEVGTCRHRDIEKFNSKKNTKTKCRLIILMLQKRKK